MFPDIRIVLTILVIIIGATDVMAIEEAAYEVVKKDGRFKIRDYAPSIFLLKPSWKEIWEGVKPTVDSSMRQHLSPVRASSVRPDRDSSTSRISHRLQGLFRDVPGVGGNQFHNN